MISLCEIIRNSRPSFQKDEPINLNSNSHLCQKDTMNSGKTLQLMKIILVLVFKIQINSTDIRTFEIEREVRHTRRILRYSVQRVPQLQ